jgi:hypothetical protein
MAPMMRRGREAKMELKLHHSRSVKEEEELPAKQLHLRLKLHLYRL